MCWWIKFQSFTHTHTHTHTYIYIYIYINTYIRLWSKRWLHQVVQVRAYCNIASSNKLGDACLGGISPQTGMSLCLQGRRKTQKPLLVLRYRSLITRLHVIWPFAASTKWLLFTSVPACVDCLKALLLFTICNNQALTIMAAVAFGGPLGTAPIKAKTIFPSPFQVKSNGQITPVEI